MRVTRLEIFGFKSFRERFVLHFDRNIIGMVGPNGCGKSNIVDALRWILGETHAKHLRGSVLEDLIFNGSQSQRPLGMAEVSLTIRPDENWRPALSSQPVSLLSLHDEVSNSVATGEEDIQASSSPEEVPLLGIGSQEQGSLVSEENLAASAVSSLLDIPGLFEAAEIQLTRRLYRSGESEYFINRVPCRLRDMIELYRLIGLGARGLSIVGQGSIGEIISKKPVERRELLEEAAGISGFRARIDAAERQLGRTAENISRVVDLIAEVERQVSFLKRQAKRARERNELKAELHGLEKELFVTKATRLERKKKSLESRCEDLGRELEDHQIRLSAFSTQLEEQRAQLESFDIEAVELHRGKEEVNTRLNQERFHQQELRVQLAQVEGKLRAISQNFQRLEDRKKAILTERERREEMLGNNESKKISAEEQLRQAEEHLAQLQRPSSPSEQDASLLEVQNDEFARVAEDVQEIPECSATVVSLEAEVRKKQADFQKKKDEIQAQRLKIATTENEIQLLRSQLSSLAEYVSRYTVSEMLSPTSGGLESDGSSQGLVEMGKVLLTGLKIPETARQAIAAILGEKVNYLVSDEPWKLAKNYSSWKQSQSPVQLPKLGVLAKGREKSFDKKILKREFSVEEHFAAPSARFLLNEVEIAAEFQLVAQAFLADVVLVDTLEEAGAFIQLSQDENNQRVIVTQAGEVVTSWGWYTTEGAGLGLLFPRMIEEKETQARALCEDLVHSEDESKTLENICVDLETQLQEKRSRYSSLLNSQKRYSVLLQQVQEAETRERKRILEEERGAHQAVRLASAEVSRVTSSLELERHRITDLNVEFAELERSHLSFHEDEELFAREKENLFQQLSEDEEAISRRKDLTETLNSLEPQLRELEKKRGLIRLELGKLAQSEHMLRRQLEERRSQHAEARIALERLDVERSMLLEDAQRNLGEEYRQVLSNELREAQENVAEDGSLPEEPGIETKISVLQVRLDALRRRLEREGDVDPQAVERYENEKERLENLRRQYHELERASKTLSQTVKQLKEISRERFLHTFQFVNTEFSRLIPRLFGGGAGHLALLFPEDPLTSGIEIVVRPPGKHLRGIDLLSGGEKALAATAILMALFLHRPGPICVLDEVDAPLDDANLERFLQLTQEISKKTQFLVITHNKLTMASSERLIGITMQEKGISTALSVSLEEAEREVEKRVVNA